VIRKNEKRPSRKKVALGRNTPSVKWLQLMDSKIIAKYYNTVNQLLSNYVDNPLMLFTFESATIPALKKIAADQNLTFWSHK
jgi:hypothetical protein